MISVLSWPIMLAIVTFFSTFLGGYLAFHRKSDLPLFLAFSGGALVAIAFFDLLPNAIEINVNAANSILMVFVAGFFFYHLFQRAIAVHDHTRAVHENHPNPKTNPTLGKIGAIGMIGHSTFDGVGIGASFQLNYELGLLIALAVILHDMNDGVSTFTLLFKAENTTKTIFGFIFIDAIAPLIGVIATFVVTIPAWTLAYILAFFSGQLTSIAATDLLPEAHMKERSWRSIILTLIGIAVIFFATRYA